MFKWVDILAIIALLVFLFLVLIYKKRGPLPDQIKYIQGKPIELRATHSGLLGGPVYDSACPSCSDTKVVPIIPFNPFDVVEIENFLLPSECDVFDETDSMKLLFTRSEEWMGIPSSRFSSFQLLSPNDTQSQYDQGVISIYVFINDNFKGGQLDFPLLLKTVQPKKGKAVIWRNLDANQELIMESVHREVIVVEGKKWVCRLSLKSNSKEISIV